MEEIINSIMQTPGNINPNVLRGQLQGIAGGGDVLVVHDNEGVLDKTWNEINDAPLAIIKRNGLMTITQYVVFCGRNLSGYVINTVSYGDNEIISEQYTVPAKDKYPVWVDPNTSSAPSINV